MDEEELVSVLVIPGSLGMAFWEDRMDEWDVYLKNVNRQYYTAKEED